MFFRPDRTETNQDEPRMDGSGNIDARLQLSLPSFLTIEQAAELLNLSPWTLRHWRWRATNGLLLPPEVKEFASSFRSYGRAVRVPTDALRHFLMVSR